MPLPKPLQPLKPIAPAPVPKREPMPLNRAEAVAIKDLERGLRHIKKYPRRVRGPALFRVAAELQIRWRPEDALRVNALALDCLDRSRYHAQRALILHSLGKIPEMVASARKGHELDPLEQRNVRFLATFAPESLKSTRAMERMIYASPDPARAATRGAVAMFRTGRPAETLRALKRALERIELDPTQRDQIEYYAGAVADFSSRRVALKYYRSPSPEGSRWAHPKAIGAASCLLHLGRVEEAWKALPELPTYCAARFEVNVSLGRIGEAYDEYRLRPQVAFLAQSFQNFLAEGKNRLVLTEGGPGDEVRFASLLKDIKATSATCDPRLQSLLQRSFPDVTFIPVARTRYEFRREDRHERQAVPFTALSYFMDDKAVAAARAADSVVGYMDTIASLRPNRDAFPRAAYLKADPLRIEEWRRYLPNDRPNVAIGWRSMLYTIQRSAHYLTAEQLAPLREVDAQFWLFQQGMQLEEYSILRDLLGAEMPPLLDVRDDFEGQAAFLSCMDAVVSPYSTTGELAGALGVPTFLMAFTPNTQWRQNPDGSDVWQGSGRVICGTSKDMSRHLADALNAHLRSVRYGVPARILREPRISPSERRLKHSQIG